MEVRRVLDATRWSACTPGSRVLDGRRGVLRSRRDADRPRPWLPHCTVARADLGLIDLHSESSAAGSRSPSRRGSIPAPGPAAGSRTGASHDRAPWLLLTMVVDAVPIAATRWNAADAQRAAHAALSRPAGAHAQAAARGDHARPRPRAVAVRPGVAADHRRRAHRPDQARLGHGVRERRGRRQGRDLPGRRDRAVPRRDAAGGRRRAGQARRVCGLAARPRDRPRRGLQRLAAHGAGAQGRADSGSPASSP